MAAVRSAGRNLDSPLLRYVVVGVVSFTVDFGALTTSFKVLHTPLWVATSIGFWLSFVVNFLLNKHFSFQAPNRTSRQLVRYTILVTVNYLITLGIVDGAEAIGIGYLVGKAVALCLLTAGTYLVYRRWVFAG